MGPVAAGRNLLDYEQAAERLGIKEDHLRKLTARRQVPFIKLPPGGRTAKVRFDPAELDDWLQQHTVAVEAHEVAS